VSVEGGRAASIAATTGAGSGLSDRFRTAQARAERLADLGLQRDYYVRKKDRGGVAEVDGLIAELQGLSAPSRSRARD